MRRPLHVEHAVAEDAAAAGAAFVLDPGRWLPPPARWGGRGRWTVELHAGRLSRTVVCRVGGVWTEGVERWRTVAWEPAALATDALPLERVLPAFAGELGVVAGDAGARLVLRGDYDPPAGVLGAAADAAALHRVAAGTAERFLADVADRLRGGGTGGTADTGAAGTGAAEAGAPEAGAPEAGAPEAGPADAGGA